VRGRGEFRSDLHHTQLAIEHQTVNAIHNVPSLFVLLACCPCSVTAQPSHRLQLHVGVVRTTSPG
jgi:hypothetical protein